MWYVASRQQTCSPNVGCVLTRARADDVLKFYGKSLEIHKGCDILDINPGAGLWSQKLHKFLQPRSHVLMEPNTDYRHFLDPLVDARDSKYKLLQKDTFHLDSYKELVTENVFPEQTLVDPADNSGQELNTTLLVTGMLAWDPVLPGIAFDSMAKQLYNHFSSAIRTNDLFHAYGRVRTLFWVGSQDFRPVLAESMQRFEKNNCLLEMTQSMEMVVNSPRRVRKVGRGSPGREANYEIESIVRAMQRARANGMELPAHRQTRVHTVAKEAEEIFGESGRCTIGWLYDYVMRKHAEGFTIPGLLSESLFEHYDEMVRLQDKYPDVDLALMGNAKGETPRTASFFKGREDHPAREEAYRFALKKAADRALVLKKEHYDSIADVAQEMYHAECRALRMQDGTEEKDALLKKIAEMDLKIEKLMNGVTRSYKVAPIVNMDDRLALHEAPGPRIQWDRRPFEPMSMEDEEAWPPHEFSLLSSTPYARPPGQTLDYYEWVHDFVYALFNNPSMPLPEALEKMQHGLSEIIDKCPSITDPDKGGRLLLKHFRVRMVTAEMIYEMVEVYRDWPFKEPGSDHNRYFRWKGQDQRFTN